MNFRREFVGDKCFTVHVTEREMGPRMPSKHQVGGSSPSGIAIKIIQYSASYSTTRGGVTTQGTVYGFALLCGDLQDIRSSIRRLFVGDQGASDVLDDFRIDQMRGRALVFNPLSELRAGQAEVRA
jgi:hypothetical protein